MTGTGEFRDPLTGAYSRLMFQQRFYEEAESAQRYASSLSIIIIDIDHFKSINDAFGHTRGDEVLMEFVERITNGIRAADILFRYGGDEFVILLPNTTRNHALNQANRLMETIRPARFTGDPPLTLTISLGLATYPEDTLDPRTLFDKADIRLLEAKSQGRNRVIHEDAHARPDLQFDQLSRLVERDSALDTLYRFLDSLPTKRRGVLMVAGVPGSGRSRFLKEIQNTAEIRGMETLLISGFSAMKNRPYGAWAEARKRWRYTIPPFQSREDLCATIEQRILEQGKESLILLVDDLHQVDRATLEFLRFLQQSIQLPSFAIVYAINTESSARSIVMDVPLRETIELNPISRSGLKIWLRSILQWEPPDTFLDWLHRETLGLPSHVAHATIYLVKRGILRRLPEGGWALTREITEIPLKDRVEIATKIPPHNLPSSLTGFVGRHPEILKLGRIIEEKRLVTLVGQGGIGKTRLALRIAEEKIRYFQDGVFFVPLAPVTAPEFIVSAIAEAIRFSFSGPQEPEEQLMSYIRNLEMLLILDNFEHLMGGAGFVGRILEKCPDIRIITTSRERLNLMEEVIFEVTGLSYPPENQPYQPEDYSAIKMFLQCARRTYPPFVLTEEIKPHIGRICRIVEGMPLGIELASAWIRVLSCQELADEISKNFDFLSTTQRDVPDRHRSMRAVFEHSWALLLNEEQQVFKRLAVFRGGFTREAALQITGTPVSTLSALMDKSLLYRTFSNRYHVLEVIRLFLGEKLDGDPDELARVAESHRKFYASFCQKSLELHREQKEKRFITQIAEEIDNIRTGWRSSTQVFDIDTLEQYIEPLSRYYSDNGMFHEGEELFRFASDVLSGIDDPTLTEHLETVIAKLYNRRGVFKFNLSQFESAMELIRRSYDVFHRRRLRKEEALALNGMGSISNRMGDFTKAREYHETALAIRREIDDRKGMAASLNNLGNVLGSLGELTLSHAYYTESLKLAREIGDRKNMAGLLANLGIAAGALGDREHERVLMQESLQIRKEMGDRVGIASALDNLGSVEQFLGNFSIARQLHRDSLQIRREIGDQWGIAMSLLSLANLHSVQNEYDAARRVFEESLSIFRRVGDRWGIAMALKGYGGMLMTIDEDGKAAPMIEECVKLFNEIGDKWGIILSKMTLAYQAFKHSAFDRALQLLREGLDIAISIRSIPMMLDSLVEITQVLIHLTPPRLMEAQAIIDQVSRHPAVSRESADRLEHLRLEAALPDALGDKSVPRFENLDDLVHWLFETPVFSSLT